jgi:hypothetical protein
MGSFELRDGKIAAWRVYWDLQQFERQLPPKESESRVRVAKSDPAQQCHPRDVRSARA